MGYRVVRLGWLGYVVLAQIRTHFVQLTVSYIKRILLKQAVVSSNGDVHFVPPVIQRTFCPVDFDSWPWGLQTCTLIFGSWTYNMDLVDIQPSEDPINHAYFKNPLVSF